MSGDFKGGGELDWQERPEEASENLAQRVLQQIVNVLYKNEGIEDFDIVPVETKISNISPLLHFGEHLGIESWCVKYIYNYAYSKLMKEYYSKSMRRRVNSGNFETVNSLLIGTLLFNPDVMTFWNLRKEMVIKNFLDCSSEFRFTKIVLSYKPKSNEVFSYRKWLLKRYFSDPSFSFSHLLNFITNEANITESCAKNSPNNYHAWSHRIWLMRLITEDCRYNSLSLMNSKYLKEFLYSEQWMYLNISDYSGFHYRQFCLSNVLNIHNFFDQIEFEKRTNYQKALNKFLLENLQVTELSVEDEIRNEMKMVNLILGVMLNSKLDLDKYLRIYQNICLLIYELQLNENLLKLFDSHETLWCHRRFVMNQIMTLIYDYFEKARPKYNNEVSELNDMYLRTDCSKNITNALLDTYKNVIDSKGFGKEPKILKCDSHSVYNSLLYKAISANEKRHINQRTKFGDTFSEKYEMWLKIVLKFSLN